MKYRFFLLDADYSEEDGIRLWGKTENGKTILTLASHEPYFYVLAKSIPPAEDKIRLILEKEKIKTRKIEKISRILNGDKKDFLKIILGTPSEVPKARESIKFLEKNGIIEEEYEYTINFYRRFLLDSKIDGSCWIEAEGEEINGKYADITIKASKIIHIEKDGIPPLRVIAFDIETFAGESGDEIGMISFFGDGMKKVITYGKGAFPKYVHVAKDEKDLLEMFVKTITDYDPDIIVTYNGDAFDFPVIQKRMDFHKVIYPISRDGSGFHFIRRAYASSARLAGRVHVDIFDFVSVVLSPKLKTETLSLDAVSAELLGERKVQTSYQEMLDTWKTKKNISKIAQYCLKDSQLAFRLEELLLPQMTEISHIVGQALFDSSRMTYGQMVEWYLSKKAARLGIIIPNQPKYDEIQKRRSFTYEGGFVKEPIPGIHENLAVLDFRSLYPSLIATFNLSPDTHECRCCKEKRVPGTSHMFCEKKKGFVSGEIEELIRDRLEIKKKMKSAGGMEYSSLDNRQYALKIIANASYGMYAFSGAKWYCKECAESAAALGRQYISKVIEEASKDFIVIYADTDSCFIKSKKGDIRKQSESFLKYINNKLPGIMELELQGIYKRGIFISKESTPGAAKKRYALIDGNGNLLIRGLETVRRDWCKLARECQRQVLVYILKKNDIRKAVRYVNDTVQRIRNRDISMDDIVIYEQLTMPLDNYRQVGPHVAAAKKMKERGKTISEGMLIMYAIAKGKGPVSQRAEPIEDITIEKIDVDYYIESQVVPAALRVLKVLGVSESELTGKGLGRFVKK